MKPTKPSHHSDEDHFIQLLDTLPKVSVQGYDVNRRVIYWNEASTVIYGYDRSETLGNRLEDLIIPDEMRDEAIQRHQAWIKQGYLFHPLSSCFVTKRGTSSQCFLHT